MRRLALSLFSLLTLAACATSYPPVSVPPSHLPAALPQADPALYLNAPRAALHSELFACAPYGANIGEIGARGEALLYTPYIYTAAGPLLRMPVEAACFSSGFGWRGVASGGGREHRGVDLANAAGGFVYAPANGWVRSVEWRGGYGLVLELDHGAGVVSLFAHLSEIDPRLAPGALVQAGAPVARMGMTGNATGVHLHYEVSVDGLLVDPMRFGVAPAPYDKDAPAS